MENLDKKNTSYDSSIHKLGRISTLIAILAIISVPILLTIVFKIDVDIKNTLVAFIGVFSLFGVVGAIEFLSYAPILGAGGQYLSFITGNISNMKLPAAVSGIKISGYESGSKEADVISTISIAISSLVTTFILFLGLFFIGAFLPILESPTLAPAFNNLMPAILGALATPIFLKDIRTSSAPCILAGLVTIILGYATVSRMQSYFMPIFLIIAVGWRYILYKKDNKK